MSEYSSFFRLLLSYCTLFRFLFFYRYVRLVGNCIGVLLYKPIQPPENPSVTHRHVTVIVPTLEGHGTQLVDTLRSICFTKRHEIILSTIDRNRGRAEETARSIKDPQIKVTVTSVRNPSKRHQVAVAIEKVETYIFILADDDVFWAPCPSFLRWLLSPFEDPKMRGVATRGPEIWDALNDCDGGVPCLSGRTLALRTDMVKDPAFLEPFVSEKWRSTQLNADDDNFITRHIIHHRWRMHFQNHPKVEVRTTLENNPKFLKQCVRWSRSNWRSKFAQLIRLDHLEVSN
ncbi:hypothetical protein ACJ73_02105 [Blastomyces percursus]|uniref:Glycosyltransferase 2-like domain-containing protein n=1 Tax=Blastomyces percursus TaxID=1658174 RepID=A0A1J9QCD8_9EURO|nr:hypothetical protein ACJ73_02105 [Blastomyces percursus]